MYLHRRHILPNLRYIHFCLIAIIIILWYLNVSWWWDTSLFFTAQVLKVCRTAGPTDVKSLKSRKIPWLAGHWQPWTCGQDFTSFLFSTPQILEGFYINKFIYIKAGNFLLVEWRTIYSAYTEVLYINWISELLW